MLKIKKLHLGSLFREAESLSEQSEDLRSVSGALFQFLKDGLSTLVR